MRAARALARNGRVNRHLLPRGSCGNRRPPKVPEILCRACSHSSPVRRHHQEMVLGLGGRRRRLAHHRRLVRALLQAPHDACTSPHHKHHPPPTAPASHSYRAAALHPAAPGRIRALHAYTSRAFSSQFRQCLVLRIRWYSSPRRNMPRPNARGILRSSPRARSASQNVPHVRAFRVQVPHAEARRGGRDHT